MGEPGAQRRAIWTSGTVEISNLGIIRITAKWAPEEEVKNLYIYTNGSLIFTGREFENRSDCFTHVDEAGVSVWNDYTEINGGVPLALTPLTCHQGGEMVFTVTNISGATRKFQIWALT